jgi:hypothetical protein
VWQARQQVVAGLRRLRRRGGAGRGAAAGHGRECVGAPRRSPLAMRPRRRPQLSRAACCQPCTAAVRAPLPVAFRHGPWSPGGRCLPPPPLPPLHLARTQAHPRPLTTQAGLFSCAFCGQECGAAEVGPGYQGSATLVDGGGCQARGAALEPAAAQALLGVPAQAFGALPSGQQLALLQVCAFGEGVGGCCWAACAIAGAASARRARIRRSCDRELCPAAGGAGGALHCVAVRRCGRGAAGGGAGGGGLDTAALRSR